MGTNIWCEVATETSPTHPSLPRKEGGFGILTLVAGGGRGYLIEITNGTQVS